MTEPSVSALPSGKSASWWTSTVFLGLVVGVAALFVWASRAPAPGSDYTQIVVGQDHPVAVVADPPTDTVTPFTVSSLTGSAALIALTLPGESASQLVAFALDAVGESLETARLLRSTTTSTDADGALRPYLTVGVLAEDGYREILGMDPSGQPLSYDPPLLAVPSDLSDGASWTSESLTAGFAPVTIEGTVANADTPAFPSGLTACRELRTTLVQEIPGAEGFTNERETIWCPGWGAVLSRNLGTGVLTRFEDARAVPWVTARPPRSAAQPPGTILRSPISVMSIIRQPIEVDGTLVIANAQVQDLIGLSVGELSAEDPTLVTKAIWMQHPGGIILGTASGGEDFYVTTSQRRLQRFDAAGRLRWSIPLPDIASGAPAVAQDIVAVTLADGTLRGFSRESGAQRWSIRMSDVITQSPAVTADGFVAADTAGSVVSVNADGSPRWSAQVDGVNAPITALPDGSVVLQQQTGAITLLDSAGEERWTEFLPDASVTSGGVQLGDIVVLPTREALIGLDAQGGSVRWSLADLANARVMANGLTAHGGRVVQLKPDGSIKPIADIAEADGGIPSRLFVAKLDGSWVAVTRGGVLVYLGVSDD